mgnify:CR=1 FL=1
MKTDAINTTALAFMGDAVYEVYVREHVMESGQQAADKLHRMAVKYVCAESQAAAVKAMFDDLSEDEQKLVKRARNRKSATKPRNTDPVTYKWATAFEALVGYLHISGDRDRAEEIINEAIAFADNGRGGNEKENR